MQHGIHILALVRGTKESMMSKQLAISSAFATLAMAAMVLTLTPDQSRFPTGEGFVPMQAELSPPSLPQPSFLN